MENRFEHTSPEEKQGWGGYVSPIGPGQWNTHPPDTSPSHKLCLRVREMLPLLVENDGELHPDMVTALYGHLGVCAACNLEFEQMRRVVTLVESLGPAEMPMDLSLRIMQRIQSEAGGLYGEPKAQTPPPFTVTPTVMSAHVSANQDAETLSFPHIRVQWKQQETEVQADATVRQTTRATESPLSSLTASGAYLWERLLLSTLLAAALAFFLLTSAGRSALGANVNAVQDWLDQVGVVLTHIPILGALFAALLLSLARIGALLSDAYRTLGEDWARGLILDTMVLGLSYYFLTARKGVRQASNT